LRESGFYANLPGSCYTGQFITKLLSNVWKHFLLMASSHPSPRFSLGPNSPLRGDRKGNLRILVVGNSGTGKSTIASALANILSVPAIYLDRLYWQPNWKEMPGDEFQSQVESFVRENDSWIIDGNFLRFVGELTFREATDIVWMDPPFALYFSRLIVRTFLRILRIAPSCSPGCDESLGDVFTWGEKSILWWSWNNHTPQREFGTSQMQGDEGRKWIRLGGWGGVVKAWLGRVETMAKDE